MLVRNGLSDGDERLNEPRHEKTCLWGLRPGKTNRPAKLQRLARILKFWL